MTGATALDPDAADYIAAIKADGETVTGVQASAIDAFYVRGKGSAAWFDKIVSMALPIWGDATPNGRNLFSGDDITYPVGVTHSAGYVEANGTTGYATTGQTPTELGVSSANVCLFRLVTTTGTNANFEGSGSRGAGTERFVIAANTVSNNHYGATASTSSAVFVASSPDYRGISIVSATATNSRFLGHRTSAGWAIAGTSTVNDTTIAPNVDVYFLAANNNGSGLTFQSTERHGAFGIGEGLTQAEAEDFTEAVQDLWETCTGLSLP